MNYPEKPFHRSAPAEGLTVALVDARYLRWLTRQDEGEGQAQGPLARDGWNELLRHLLQRHGLRGTLLRTYWYAVQDDQAVHDDQTLRVLSSADTDGVALVRQMTADLQALVAGGRIDTLCIASDDDRLMTVIDAAKLAGVTVCLVADERTQSMPRLMQQDPSWARLLREADRRIVLRSSELAQALSARSQVPADGPVSADLDARLQAVVQAWWDDLVEDDRDSLREELPGQRGLPPEVDRELLLRAKNAIGRSLNFQEKRVLRSQARHQATGESHEAGAPSHEDA
ncbi:MAG: hypothetical protein WCK08_12200 [Betaproteobacteria bacterium]